jgi:hypothetical protein
VKSPPLKIYTVTNGNRDAGAQLAVSVIHGKIRHPHGLNRSTYVDDGIFQRPHVVLLRHA